MSSDEHKADSSIIATRNSQALAKKTSSLATRGLRALQNWDSAKLIEAVKAISAARYEDEIINVLKTKIPELIQPDAWSLLLTQPDDTKERGPEGGPTIPVLRFEILAGEEVRLSEDNEVSALATKRFRMGSSIAGWVAENRETVLLSDGRKDSRFAPEVDGRALADTDSLLAVPLRFQDECFGVIELVNQEGSRAFSEADARTLETLADFTAIAIGKSRYLMEAAEPLIIDARTGLYTERFFREALWAELRRSERHGREFSLLGIDLFELKFVSDFYSYVNFNHLLAEIGGRLRAAGRRSDCVCRYGEGEFIILLPETTPDRASAIARCVLQSMEQPFRADGGQNIKCVAAIVTYPADGSNVKELIAALDYRLHEAKVGHK